MTSLGAVRVVTYRALDALGRLVVAGVANLPASPFRGLLWGSAKAHLVYVPVTGDQLVLARTSGGVDQPLTGAIDPAAVITAQTFAAGDIGIRTAVGAIIRVSALGDIYLTPAPGRSVILAGGTADAVGSGAAVSVSGTISAFGSFTATGTVTAPGNAGCKV
jgi:hypothetical protein